MPLASFNFLLLSYKMFLPVSRGFKRKIHFGEKCTEFQNMSGKQLVQAAIFTEKAGFFFAVFDDSHKLTVLPVLSL
jgi:hypothetical protein